jgi:uncharacterized protein YeaO (DUF488 family)
MKTTVKRQRPPSGGIALKRVYLPPEKADGARILVDRLWPRGVRKETAKLDLWLRDIAPSDTLRHWFGHEPARWPEFKRRYRAELKGRSFELQPIRDALKKGRVTLLFAAHDEERNNAVALKELIESRERAAAKRREKARA